MGRRSGLTSFALLGVASSGDDSMGLQVSDADRKKAGRGLPNSCWIVRGGNRLSRLPLRDSSSNFFASSRPWKAKASRGDSAGGTVPVCGGLRLGPSLWEEYEGRGGASKGVVGRLR
jgi:hypothetical protein